MPSPHTMVNNLVTSPMSMHSVTYKRSRNTRHRDKKTSDSPQPFSQSRSRWVIGQACLPASEPLRAEGAAAPLQRAARTAATQNSLRHTARLSRRSTTSSASMTSQKRHRPSPWPLRPSAAPAHYQTAPRSPSRGAGPPRRTSRSAGIPARHGSWLTHSLMPQRDPPAGAAPLPHHRPERPATAWGGHGPRQGGAWGGHESQRCPRRRERTTEGCPQLRRASCRNWAGSRSRSRPNPAPPGAAFSPLPWKPPSRRAWAVKEWLTAGSTPG